MRLVSTLTLACLMTVEMSAPPASAQANEVVHFSSAVLPPSAFKLRRANERGEELVRAPGYPLWGHLGKPVGVGPFPAVVLLHSCEGIRPTHGRWASRLNALGYVTLLVDSLGPRSLFTLCKDYFRGAPPNIRALDAHGALAYLQGLPFVDPERIGVLGWSHGGNSALAAVDGIGIAARLTRRFKAAIAFYPYCADSGDYDLPTLILSGAADEWTPFSRCQVMKAQSKNGGASIELVAYPGAYHAFDVAELGQGRAYGGPGGKTYWIQYDEAAHADAVKRVSSFLAASLSSQ